MKAGAVPAFMHDRPADALLADSAARDAIAGLAGGIAGVIVFLCVNHQCRSIGIEQRGGTRIEGDTLDEVFHGELAGRRHIKVRKVAEVRSALVEESVSLARGTHVAAGRLERRSVAAADLVKMDRMQSWRRL